MRIPRVHYYGLWIQCGLTRKSYGGQAGPMMNTATVYENESSDEEVAEFYGDQALNEAQTWCKLYRETKLRKHNVEFMKSTPV